jgi:hypothetical protein
MHGNVVLLLIKVLKLRHNCISKKEIFDMVVPFPNKTLKGHETLTDD